MRLAVVALLVLAPAAAQAAREAHLVSYGAYATTEAIVVRGRVARGAPLAAKDRGRVRKVLATARAFAGRDVEHARVVIRDVEDGGAAFMRADDEGFFEARLPGPFPPGPREVEVALSEKGWRAPVLRLRVHVVDGSSGLVVVTDIDDTIIETGVTGGKASLIKRIASSDERDIKPYPGAAAALRAFAEAGVPIVYVSASPVEIGPRLMRFLELAEFPAGALFLRHYTSDGLGDPTAYKRKRIDRLLADFPGRKLILFGDNGEKDRDIFATLARETGRVFLSYIRRTLPDERMLEGQVVFGEWPEVLAHARELGLVR
jgi:phosphatidate phosphatase APP1